jgi:hypothetical protein
MCNDSPLDLFFDYQRLNQIIFTPEHLPSASFCSQYLERFGSESHIASKDLSIFAKER